MLSLYKVALGLAALSTVSAQWASFCDDDACSENCGIAVDVTNPGCLNEVGRNSVYYQGSGISVWEQVSLLASPGSDCPCQSDCALFFDANSEEGCYTWEGLGIAQSLRFVGGECPANNC